MNQETDKYYGKDEPSRTYRWGLVYGAFDSRVGVRTWCAVSWFKSRKAAQDHAARGGLRNYAVCRIERFEGTPV